MDAITKKINQAMTSFDVPGLGLVILTKDKSKFKTFGTSNLSTGEKITNDSLWQICSISKNITATATAWLTNSSDTHEEESKRVTFDTKINTGTTINIPFQSKVVNNNLNVRDCLSHTSGISGTLEGEIGGVAMSYGYSKKFFYKSIVHYPTERFRSKFEYSNNMFTLGFNRVAVGLNSKMEEQLKLFFKRAGMTHTITNFKEISKNPSRVTSYDSNLCPTSPFNGTQFVAAGGIASTLTDLSTFVRLHLNGGDGWIDNISDIYEPVVRSGFPNGKFYGMGTAIDTINNETVLFHPGAFITGLSHMCLYSVKYQIGIVILTNSFNPIPIPLAYYIYIILRGKSKKIANCVYNKTLVQSVAAVNDYNCDQIERSGTCTTTLFDGQFYNNQNGSLDVWEGYLKIGKLKSVPYTYDGKRIHFVITNINRTDLPGYGELVWDIPDVCNGVTEKTVVAINTFIGCDGTMYDKIS